MATIPFSRPTPASPSWLTQCQSTKAGPIPNLANTALGLREDPSLKGLLAFDDMLRAPALTKAIPGANRAAARYPCQLDDVDRDALQEYLQLVGLKRIGKGIIDQAIELVAHEVIFHPFRDELRRLGDQWDGTLRQSEWLHTYLGAKNDDYSKGVGSWWLSGAVKRIFEPGCKMDYMLILEGDQGILKSAACRTLAGAAHFSDTLPDLASHYVRLCMHLRGKWIIEIPELHAFFTSKVDSAKLKAFITTPVEQYTPMFGHREVVEPRQCVFIGTTNKDTYLRDETGSRRFWPVKCGVIDIDSLERDRNQLIGEAVVTYQRGAQCYPDRAFEEKYIKPMQDSRYEADAWDTPILAYLLGQRRVTLLDVAQQALSLEVNRVGRSEQLRIAQTLRQAGWRDHRGVGGGARYWTPPQTPPSP